MTQFTLHSLFHPIFFIENMGKTEVKNLYAIIYVKFPLDVWREAFKMNNKINLSSGQTSQIRIKWELPINSPLPDEVSFKIQLIYEDINNIKHNKELLVKWTSNDGLWSYATP
ncbi:MAG: hypothetical protein KKG00_12770 [Bacteroidetes bacterium]|nr:hypothetical protein [Bacteroidota bacterium]